MEDIQGFQVTTIDEVPVAERAQRGIYGELIENVPDSGALQIDIGDAKKAATKVAGLRGYLRRHNKVDDYTVVRQGQLIFVAKK